MPMSAVALGFILEAAGRPAPCREFRFAPPRPRPGALATGFEILKTIKENQTCPAGAVGWRHAADRASRNAIIYQLV
jgi:hypothetical protein